ncbi:HAMP domain-containing histidine kinase [Faecalicatena sp. AGMB00832]|uniref:histidine kinase n=1 Tax=Faecalicatena faecalis TaxID=2726362 RepID=A0ABS6D6I8_9FIRM|nr:HAMP domain-containing sensor histidine kinase [Faecalicatena faecalis]MBU3877218.1 HAMP domain-containing histidine kinase [Faecalicatena faecalis]
MLNRLYKKLHLIFTGAVMLIITLIIGIVLMNDLKTEQMNENTLFQRMATLLIYQLEDHDQDMEASISPYEEKYSIFCLLRDSGGQPVYQSRIAFPTKADLLLERLEKQSGTQTALKSKTPPADGFGKAAATTQQGVFEIEGTSNDRYWGIPAQIASKSGDVYDLTLLYQQKNVWEQLKGHLIFYAVVWFTSLACVVFISHLLLKKALEPTERALKSQKEFVASASHELKSPLAVLLVNLDLIDGLGIDDSRLKKAVRTMDNECMRMSRLVKDMLLLASSDAGTWTLNQSSVDIDTLLITLYETYELLCQKKGISLSLDLSDCSYPVLYTDRERLMQILNIYMDNSLQHSKKQADIQIKAEFTGKTITFYVIDHGQGIAKEDKPFIFDRFYCADKAHADKTHFGLGLSIAKELAKMLHGQVGVKDTEGGGATFFVAFPLKTK